MWELPPVVSEHENLISGIWKFGPNIPVKTLVTIAKEWAATDYQHRYLDLHVRACSSKGQYGIGFKYLLQESETQKDFFHRITDKLKRAYGNDFIGWDLSGPTILITHHSRYALAESNGVAYVDPAVVYKDEVAQVVASPAYGNYQTAFYVRDLRRNAEIIAVLAAEPKEYKIGGGKKLPRPFFSVTQRFPSPHQVKICEKDRSDVTVDFLPVEEEKNEAQ